MRSYEEFGQAMAESESSANYACVNALGYLGAYQFGGSELYDLGAMERIPGTHAITNACFRFIMPMTEAKFLAAKDFQDYLFDQHVRRLVARFKKIGMTSNLSGAVAVAHLVGFQGALEYLSKGKEMKDAFGTTAAEYFRKFEGFDVG